MSSENTDGRGETRARRLERQLEVAQQITHIGSWEWSIASNQVTWSDELYRIYGLEPQSCEITFELFLGKLHPEDRGRVQSMVGRALQTGERFQYPERIYRPDGSMRHLDTVGEAARDKNGVIVGLIGTCRDVTDETRARQLRDQEQRILEMIATGAPLGEIFRALVLAIEEHSPPTIASILVLDETGTKVRTGAAPSLPEAFNDAVDGSPIGPKAGSCGTAAFRRSPVFVHDIELDPLWADYRELARTHGLRACWSTPILTTDGRVLATFALYYREPRSPGDHDKALIARATHLAGIAIERSALEEQLRALSAHVESVREEERAGIAREIHDELGQALTALKMDVAWILRRTATAEGLARETLVEKLSAMSTMTDEIIHVVRRISAELRPGVLDDLGLLAAVEWQAQEFEERSGCTCVVRSNLGDAKVERDTATAAFRIFQEALTNVARHARARHVEVRLDREGENLRLEIIDDGRGISVEEMVRSSSLGILGIRERARRLGGVALVMRAEPNGTVVSLSLPLKVKR